MIGFRPLGRIELVSVNDYNEGDLLYFSPNEEGGDWRTGHIRARDFDLFKCQTFVVTGACPSDFMFVATAIGERCFK